MHCHMLPIHCHKLYVVLIMLHELVWLMALWLFVDWLTDWLPHPWLSLRMSSGHRGWRSGPLEGMLRAVVKYFIYQYVVLYNNIQYSTYQYTVLCPVPGITTLPCVHQDCANQTGGTENKAIGHQEAYQKFLSSDQPSPHNMMQCVPPWHRYFGASLKG